MKLNALMRLLCLWILLPVLLPVLAACGAPALPQVSPPDPLVMSPQEVVEAFYNWYLEYPGSPLAHQAYRQSPFLSDALIRRTDGALLDKAEPLMHDPFLLAQDVPREISVESNGTGEQTAQVILHQYYSAGLVRDLAIDLVQEGGEWKIDQIQEGNPLTADGTTRLFYGWYIRYNREHGSPLEDGAYLASPYLSAAFIEKIRQAQADPVAAPLDPLGLEAEPPIGFRAYQPVPEEDGARVQVECYWQVPDQRPEIKLVEVYLSQRELSQREGAWQITDIRAPKRDAAGKLAVPALPMLQPQKANLYIDEEYAFSFQYPADWILHKVDEAPNPQDPIQSSMMLMPAAISSEVLAPVDFSQMTGPRPMPPFMIHILSCSEQDFVNSFPPAESEEQLVANGITVRIRQLVNGSLQHVIAHPQQPDVWIVFFDLIHDDPRYVELEQAAQLALDLVLGSFEFSQ